MHNRRFPTALLAVSFVAASLTAAPGSAAAKRRPDLVVTAASASSTVLPPGAKLQVTDTVKNRGTADAGVSTNGYFLSTDQTAGGDVKLTGSRKVKSLAPRRASKGTARLTVPASTAPGAYHLVVCADGPKKVAESSERNNCRFGDDIKIRAATDHDLIDQALAAGEIDAETAVIYEVFSDFNDPRLPAEFAGDDSLVFESDVLTTVARDLAGYSPETRAILEPFLIPPFHSASWWHLQNGGSPNPPPRARQTDPDYEYRCKGNEPDEFPRFTEWAYVDAASGKVRIWWQKTNEATDQPLAQKMATMIDAHIWPEIITKLGYAEPLGDDGGDINVTCRGGSDAYDISLVDIPRSNTWTSYKCDGTWAGTLFNRNEVAADIPELLAHEIFHASQYSYNVKNGCLTSGGEYGVWKEATAQWIEDELYPGDNREHGFADRMLDEPELSLDDPGKWPREDRFYGEYLLPFFLARTGRKAAIKQVWDNTTSMSMLAALKAPFGAGWDDLWKEFSLHNFNRGDYNYYEQWDGLKKAAEYEEEGTLPKGVASFKVDVSPVAAKYYRFVPRSGLTSLKFENNSVDVQGVGIQAIIKYADGTWKKRDWSDKASVDLCLRDPEVKEVTLILSNSNTDVSIPQIDFKWTGQEDLCCTGEPLGKRAAKRETLERSAAVAQRGCPDRWVGSVSGSSVVPLIDGGARKGEWEAAVTFERRRGCIDDAACYEFVGGSITMKASEDYAGCSYEGTGTASLDGLAGELTIYTEIVNGQVKYYGQIWDYGGDNRVPYVEAALVRGDEFCEQSVMLDALPGSEKVLQTDLYAKMGADATTMSGESVVGDFPTDYTRWEWALSRR